MDYLIFGAALMMIGLVADFSQKMAKEKDPPRLIWRGTSRMATMMFVLLVLLSAIHVTLQVLSGGNG